VIRARAAKLAIRWKSIGLGAGSGISGLQQVRLRHQIKSPDGPALHLAVRL